MIKNYVFSLPPDPNDIIHTFNLKKIKNTDRTSIYENSLSRFSIDKNVVRVLLFDANNAEFIEIIRNYFYRKYNTKEQENYSSAL